MKNVLIALVVLTVLGAVFGMILAFAAKVFAVKKDPREEAIAGCLPGANCGGCGFPGCGGYAAAVVAGTAPVNACAAGGAAVAAKIAEIMGVAAGDSVKKNAAVLAVVWISVSTIMKESKIVWQLPGCLAAALWGATTVAWAWAPVRRFVLLTLFM